MRIRPRFLDQQSEISDAQAFVPNCVSVPAAVCA